MELNFKKQYLQIHKDKEPHLIELLPFRGVVIDNPQDGSTNVFWFLVEDLVSLDRNSQDRLTLITKLLNNISDKHKGFVNVVDARGNIREVLMVSIEGLRGKLLS